MATFPVLLGNLAVQQCPASLPVTGVPDILSDDGDLRYAAPKPDQPGPGHGFPATTGKRFVDWAEFIATEPHDIPAVGTG